jgi:hypothetical protein
VLRDPRGYLEVIGAPKGGILSTPRKSIGRSKTAFLTTGHLKKALAASHVNTKVADKKVGPKVTKEEK